MIRLIFFVLLLTLLSPQVHADGRVALVIGNSNYQHVSELTNPRNDAEAMSKTLRRLGFEVILGIDLDRSKFEAKIRQFSKAVRGSSIALLFYAGHGLQVNGRNYLAPIDTELLDEADLEFEAIRLENIMAQMEREERTNLVFLDACRNNPLARNLRRSMGTRSASIGRGLAPVETGIGTLITYATQPGNVALDGNGKNSPFTTSLLRHIETPGEDLAVILRQVRQEVIKATNGKQVPWGNSSLTGKVVLKANTNIKNSRQDANVANNPTTQRQMELAYWQSIKDTNKKEYFESFLSEFPNSAFASLAKLRIANIDSRKKEANDRLARLENVDKNNVTREKENKKQAAKQLALRIQKELNRVGCSAGTPDGIWGKGSRHAANNFNKYGKMALASLNPNQALLDHIRSKSTRICPLTCKTGYEVKNGACERLQQQASLEVETSVQPSKFSSSELAALVKNGESSRQRGDFSKAIELFSKAANQGYAPGQVQLGSMYYSGYSGVPVDYAKALSLFRKAANQGNGAGEAGVAMMYQNGQGVTKDNAKAKEWYRKAAKKGNRYAKIQLRKLR